MIEHNIFSIFPGPEVIGEPFWCLMDKKFFKSILKLYTENFKDLAPLLFVPPFLGGKKVLTLKMTTEELQYYATHGKFIDEGFQKAIDYAFNIVNNPSPDMYTKRLSIDPFLNFLKDNYQKCARPYPNLPNIIEDYRSAIWEAAEHIEDEHEKLMKNMSPKDQCYTRTFMIDEKCSYDITWVVPT